MTFKMNWILPTLALFLVFLLIVIVIIVFILEKNVENSGVCPEGTNPVDNFTGERYTDRQTYSFVSESCQKVGLCNPDGFNPYAVQPDGSTELEFCAENENCDCVATKNCPNVVKTFFNRYGFNGSYYYLPVGVYKQLNGTFSWSTPLQTSPNSLCSLGESSLVNVFNHSCINGRLTLLSDGSYACTDAPACSGNIIPSFDLSSQTFGCSGKTFPSFWRI